MSEFEQLLSVLVTSHTPRGWVFVAPPGVVEGRTGTRGRTNADIETYRLAAIEMCDQVRAHVVRADLVLAPLGAKAFAEDGLHLNGTGCRLLVRAISASLDALPSGGSR